MFIHFRWILIFTLQKDGAHLPHGFLSGAGSGAVTGPGGSEPLGGCQEDPGVAEASPGLLFGLEVGPGKVPLFLSLGRRMPKGWAIGAGQRIGAEDWPTKRSVDGMLLDTKCHSRDLEP